MKPHLFFFFAISVTTGCTSSYEASDNSAPDKSFVDRVNMNAWDRTVAIRTTEGNEIIATRLLAGGDSTSFVESASDRSMTIATSSIVTIRIERAGAGAVDGLIWGALIGAPIGIFLGKVAAGLEDNGDFADWMVVACPVNTLCGSI